MSWVDLFYLVKPLVPRRAQIAIRRRLAVVKTARCAATWPIWPVAGQAPRNWAGWPDAKKFALVLIHDVDTERGLENGPSLAELETRRGFRSSFNFVPEGYPMDGAFRRQLRGSGFEVGVHGLTHDGRLFRDARTFAAIVPKINAYLQEWDVVGYTSPAMLSNLRWVADLNIEYSCSSFDTDPLEPRPFGVATIFPFRVRNLSGSRSYIEIPYTLPQDHSLFVLLRQNDITTWQRKLDWIAEKGGVALVNTHPDYMDFKGGGGSFNTYPWRLYADFLEFVAGRYEGRYWNALPRDLGRFWRASYPDDATYDYGGTEITASNRVAVYSKREKLHWEHKLALACTPGGHFEQMQNLSDLYRQYPHFWITTRAPQTEHSVGGTARAYFVKAAHFKKPWRYLKQIHLVLRILRKERPTHMLSTGSGLVVFIPFLVSRLFKIKFIHIETFSHVHHPTKMGSFLLRFRHPVLSQWDGVKHRNVTSIGPIISDKGPSLKAAGDEDLVFVTLGTRPQPFPRLVETVETLIKSGVIREKVVVQMGHTKSGTDLMETFGFCSPAEIVEFIASAKYVITQESAGIVTKCLKLGKRFIVMPRDFRHGELPARSDMNEDLHVQLAEMGFTYVVHDPEQMKEAILNIGRLRTGFRFDNRRAIAYLKNLIETS